MRIFGARLQKAQLFLDAYLLWCRNDGSAFTLRKCLKALNAKPVIDQSDDNVADNGLCATGQFTVVP